MNEIDTHRLASDARNAAKHLGRRLDNDLDSLRCTETTKENADLAAALEASARLLRTIETKLTTEGKP